MRMSDSTAQHRASAQSQRARCALLTISDTRDKSNDASGQLILERMQAAGHEVAHYEIVMDDAPAIEAVLRIWLEATPGLDVILTTGGTGIARRDTTIEVVRRLLDKPLDGFGELFRMLSWQEIGSAAMLSRAAAGLAGETLIFALPGSRHAVELALSRLIVPELPHLIWERKR